MADESLSARVDRVEVVVSGLEGLPAQVADLARRTSSVELQILQLRGEMQVGFSAVRSEMREGFVSVTTELGQQILEVGSQSRAMFEEVLGRLASIDEGRKGA